MDFREKGLWLKSEWDFTPDKWSCIGFKKEKEQDSFFKKTGAGSIIAFWIAQGRSEDKDMSGNLVGFFELSEEKGAIQKFVCPEFWAEHQLKSETKNRWLYGVGISRAWLVNKDDWQGIETILPNTYKPKSCRPIARWGKEIKETNFSNIKRLRIDPVKVYGQPLPDAEPEIETVEDLLRLREIQLYGYDGFPAKPEPIRAEDSIKPSRAGPINDGGYEVKKSVKKRHLYILQLEGSPADWLGKHYSLDCKNKIIVKVGLSHSFKERIGDIQSNYPFGQFRWHVMFSTEFNHSAVDGNDALRGEAGMKDFFNTHPEVKSLGGEFYLVPKNLCKECFDAGLATIT